MEPVKVQTPNGEVDVKIQERFTLSWRDVVKGLVIAALSPAIPIIQQSITAGNFVFDWKAIVAASVGGLLIYLTKNFLSQTASVTQPKN